MPKSLLLTQAEKANKDEGKVFNYLSSLNDDWHVIWGYYAGENGEEGDFLIMGPQGGLLVLEVKGWDSLAVNDRGEWRGDTNENPFVQLDKLWSRIIEIVNPEGASTENPLHVVRALALPNATRNDLNNLPHVTERKEHILTGTDLKDFSESWTRMFSDAPSRYYPNEKSKERFFKYGPGKRFEENPESVLIDYLDREIDRFSSAKFEILNVLPSYRRFVIQGGVGTGKTWFLMELALRFAGRDDKNYKSVLFLCYNKALKESLTNQLARLTSKLKPKTHRNAVKDHLKIKCWEDVLVEVAQGAQLDCQPASESKEDLNKYYSEDLPAAIALALEDCDTQIPAIYDALVVDEAQDHDTTKDGFETGYWSLYQALLKDPGNAPIAVAFDKSQRQAFFDPDGFNEDDLFQWMGNDPVRINLQNHLRSTRVVYDYLKSLKGQGTLKFPVFEENNAIKGLSDSVKTIETDAETLGSSIDTIIQEWTDTGLVAAEDILLILAYQSYMEKLPKSFCDGKYPVVNYETKTKGTIGVMTAGRCKGTESRAVILAGFGPYTDLKSGFRQSFCLAASRARQLLAVVTIKPKELSQEELPL